MYNINYIVRIDGLSYRLYFYAMRITDTEVGQGQISERLWKLRKLKFTFTNKNFKSFLVKDKTFDVRYKKKK